MNTHDEDWPGEAMTDQEARVKIHDSYAAAIVFAAAFFAISLGIVGSC